MTEEVIKADSFHNNNTISNGNATEEAPPLDENSVTPIDRADVNTPIEMAEGDLICAFSVGDLVWAFLPGSPLWPSLITPDAATGVFSKMKRNFGMLN